ncbi:MAG: Twin-arginine translocation pathway signal [Verrucomicrobiales bacterium]|nr:Twin-arginine translocation pathway signal [Verrucomicrobiales bacterium]
MTLRSYFFLFTALWAGLFATPAGATKAPNILFIFSDDQGMNDIGCYGSEIPTPHIDSIAKNGIKFDSFYVAAPVCTPSRFALLTGRFPNRAQDDLRHALMFLDKRDDTVGIHTNETTMSQVLQKKGYRTALLGKWHLGHGSPAFFPNEHGFDYSYGTTGGCIDYFSLKYGDKPDWARNGTLIEEQGYSTDLISSEAVHFLEGQKSAKPFFLYLAYTSPHYGKGWNEKTHKPTNVLQAKEKDRERLSQIADKDRREFAGMVVAMDDGIGRVLETLHRMKLEKDTLVIFACDNGADPHYGGSNKPFRGQKNQLFEGGIHVPCLAQWPGKIKAGQTIQEPITALDFFPTFCELTGAKTKGLPLDGNSILPLLLKQRAPKQRDLFWRTQAADALRRGSWKYLRVGKDEMLFNLKDDPYEQKNLADTKPELLSELRTAHNKIAGSFPAKVPDQNF